MKTEDGFRRNLSPMGAWAFALGTSIGWGSLVVTSSEYLAQAGPAGSVAGLLIGAVVMLLIGKNYAYLIQCIPASGGAYSWSSEVFGHDHGFLTGWFLILTYFSMLWANATSIPLFARYFFGDVLRFGYMYSLFGYEVYLGEALVSAAAVLLTALLITRRKHAAAILMIILALLFTACILLAFFGSVFRLDLPLSPGFVPDTNAVSQIIQIAVISPWAFIGFESISHGAEEYDFQRKRIFRVFVITILSATLLYVLVTLLSVSAYPPQYASWLEYIRDLGSLEGLAGLPAFYAANHYMGSFGVGILMAALLALILTSLIGNMTALSRLFCALGKDKVLPERFGRLNRRQTPGNAILLTAVISAVIPFLGRTTIGWIVDVTTIGAVIIYTLVSAAARKLAAGRGDLTEKRTGTAGMLIMLGFGLYRLLPNLITNGNMARETFFLFIIWSILGFLFFRALLQRDKTNRFGKSIIVWVVLLALVLFIALIWMRQSMISSNGEMSQNIRNYYAETADGSDTRLADEAFMEAQMERLDYSDGITILMATGMFGFALIIMLTNYTYMNRRTQESEKIANTDPMTGVKSKHAYMMRERDMNAEIAENLSGAFGVVVCDVNGLKHINDTYGHKAGDEYIRAACSMICDLFRHSPVFRIGGDEFAVILTGRDFESRENIVRTLNQKSEENIRTGNVVVSAGLSVYRPGEDLDVHTVFHRADTLMYEKKQELKKLGAKMR